MNQVLLINRINTNDNSIIKRRISFILGGINLSSMEDKLIDTINNSGLIDDSNDVLYKYNGVEISMSTQTIPKIVRLLANANIPIYSVYEVYNSDL
jgi:hypothetical protein